MKLLSISRNSPGQVLVITAITLFVLIGVSALAIDLGMAYTLKAKLSAAVDAAAIAGGKAVKTGTDDTARKNNGETVARAYFNANFPAGFMASDKNNTIFTATAIHNMDTSSPDYGTWKLTTSASTRSPSLFSRIFGASYTAVGASSESTTKMLDMMLVLDCSGSLAPPTSSSSTFPLLKNAAMDFIDKFQDGTGGDRIGLVTFASGAQLSLAINKTAARGFTRSTLYNSTRSSGIIPGLYADGATSSEEAMRIAKSELDAIPTNLRSSLRVIVFFSDGAPNIVTARFMNGSTPVTGGLWAQDVESGKPHDIYQLGVVHGTSSTANNITTLPATDYTNTVNLVSLYANNPRPSFTLTNTWCNVNKAARNMLENVAISARSGAGNNAITIYSIGLGTDLTHNEVTTCSYDSHEYGQNILKRLANTADSDRYDAAQPTGMYVYAADASQLSAAFEKVASMILRLSK